MCALEGQAEGEGRKPAGKGLSERLEGKVYGPQMIEGKQQTQNHQNACQNYRFQGPAWGPLSGRAGGSMGDKNLLVTSSWPGNMGRTTGVSN